MPPKKARPLGKRQRGADGSLLPQARDEAAERAARAGAPRRVAPRPPPSAAARAARARAAAAAAKRGRPRGAPTDVPARAEAGGRELPDPLPFAKVRSRQGV